MLGFGDTGHIPLPDGEIDAGDRLTLLGLYRGIVAGLGAGIRIAEAKAAQAKKRLRPTPQALDFRKILADRLEATELAERRMLTQRIGVEQANLRTIVASMASADDQRQRHLQMQISQIESRIKDLQMHLSRLKGLRQ